MSMCTHGLFSCYCSVGDLLCSHEEHRIGVLLFALGPQLKPSVGRGVHVVFGLMQWL